MNFKVTLPDRNNHQIPYHLKVFAGGEVQVRLGKLPVGFRESVHVAKVNIDGIIKNSEMFMELAMLCDALRQASYCQITCDLHYLPYARQDRVCSPGEAFSLAQFCYMLESVNCHKVIFDDIHSGVGGEWLRKAGLNFQIRHQHEILNNYLPVSSLVIVSPDKGAYHKAEKVARNSINDLVSYNKVRDPNTGAIKATGINDEEKSNLLVKGKDCLIVDDISDGNRSFVPIIKDLKSRGARKVYMCMTHAILKYGLDNVFDSGLDHFFYVNSFLDEELKGMSHVSKIEEVINNEMMEGDKK